MDILEFLRDHLVGAVMLKADAVSDARRFAQPAAAAEMVAKAEAFRKSKAVAEAAAEFKRGIDERYARNELSR